MNTRSITKKKICANAEISNIMKILGLSIGIFGKEKDKEKKKYVNEN